MPSVAVIIPTTGDPLVREAIASVLAQTHAEVELFIVVDGPGFKPAFEAATQGLDLGRAHVSSLPVNVGANGFYGHRVYAAFSHLVNTDYIAYLDQDNRFAPEHLTTLVAAAEQGGWDWAFALRRVVAPNGEFLIKDESQSVGPWGEAKPMPLVDTNCYLLRTRVAAQVASHFHGGWGQDRVFYAALSGHFPNFGCSGSFTVDYRTRDDLQPKVVALLERENAAMHARHAQGLPWVGQATAATPISKAPSAPPPLLQTSRSGRSVEFSCLYWDNTPQQQMLAHVSVMQHFGIPVRYCGENTPHGAWLDRVCAESTADVIGFFDSDCVPLSRERIEELLEYVVEHDSFVGVAQASNHIPPASHVYAAPAFFMITRACWERLGRPSFVHRPGVCDVGEWISLAAEAHRQRYRCLYPKSFEREPVEGLWPLGNFGYYGIGTNFDDTVFHLYQGRFAHNLQLFIERCGEIVDGRYSDARAISARCLDFKGRIVP